MIHFFQQLKEKYSQTIDKIADVVLGNDRHPRQQRVLDAIKLHGPKLYVSSIGRPLLLLGISIGATLYNPSITSGLVLGGSALLGISSAIYRNYKLHAYIDFVGKSDFELSQLPTKDHSDFNTGINDNLTLFPTLTWKHSNAYMAGYLSNEVGDQSLTERVRAASEKRATQRCSNH